MDITVSLDSLLNWLGFLSRDNRRWLGEHLLQQVAEEEKTAKNKDEEFVRKFLNMPVGYHNTAEEEKKLIRESHYFDPDRKINHIWDGKK